jgi:hypothetical protein
MDRHLEMAFFQRRNFFSLSAVSICGRKSVTFA